jgi:hypothetical protein
MESAERLATRYRADRAARKPGPIFFLPKKRLGQTEESTGKGELAAFNRRVSTTRSAAIRMPPKPTPLQNESLSTSTPTAWSAFFASLAR